VVLILNKKIEVRKSPIHGYGVFATEDILPGEILEECHVIIFPNMITLTPISVLNDYGFKWPGANNAIPLGTGCIYNSSPNNNATYTNDLKRQLIIFTAVKLIKKGEEICTNYEASIKKGKQLKQQMKQTFNIS